MNRLMLLVALLALPAFAADKQVCTLSVTTGSAASTSTPTSGTCSWTKGQVILMQCTVDVIIDANLNATASATSGSRVAFSSGQDAYPIYLGTNDKDVSVIAQSASGTCYFFTTQRRRPW